MSAHRPRRRTSRPAGAVCHAPASAGRAQVQVRWEVYNVFNHTQDLDFDRRPRFDAQGNQVNARFGQAITARPARIMQGSLRFSV